MKQQSLYTQKFCAKQRTSWHPEAFHQCYYYSGDNTDGCITALTSLILVGAKTGQTTVLDDQQL